MTARSSGFPQRLRVKVKTGDLLYFNTWGGGGWGDPFARDPELVKQDVARRLVSAEGAKRYGVVINTDGTVNTDATQILRAELKAAAGSHHCLILVAI